MKKILMILFILGITLITGCGNKGYTEVNYNELEQKLENKDNFVLVIGSETCGACANYEITMKKVINKNNVEIFYLDLHALSDDDYAKAYSKFVFQSTPTTVFIKDGKETTTYDRIIGSAGYNDVVEALKKHGMIGE